MSTPLESASRAANSAPPALESEERARRRVGRSSFAARCCHGVSRWLAVAVLVLAPLPFGSVDPPFVAAWCFLLAASLFLADYRWLGAAQRRVLLSIAAGLAVYLGAALLQASQPLWLVPADPIWARAGELLDETFAPRPTAQADRIPFALGPPLLFALALMRALILACEPGGARLIRRAVAWTAVAVAIYGAASLLIDPGMLLWRRKEAYLSNLTGTFINRNTAAAYFSAASLVWLLSGLSRLRRHVGGYGLREKAWLLINAPRRAVILDVAAALLLLGAVGATGSRAGFLLTILAWTVACLIYLPLRSIASQLGAAPLLAAALAALLLFELWGEGVAWRIERQGLADAGRIHALQATMRIIAEHPLLGVGLGGFADYFPSQRPPELGNFGIWDRAHNTPLEIAAEMGAPTAAILVALWLWRLAGLGYASLAARRRDVVVAFAAGLAASLHSLVDFPLQIPGYAVTFAAIAALGLARLDAPARQHRPALQTS